VNDRHEKGGADDGPQDREWISADGDHKRLRELEQSSNPRPKKCPDEAKDYRDDQPTTNATRDRFPDGAANSRDHDEKQEFRCTSRTQQRKFLWIRAGVNNGPADSTALRDRIGFQQADRTLNLRRRL
jgi:hypothetical protein